SLFLAPSPVFFLTPPRPPISTLFPYTTLFRSPLAPSPFRSPQATSTGSCSAKTASASARASSLARPRHFSAGPLFRAFFAPLERSEEHTSELQSRGHLVCRLLLEKKKKNKRKT